MKERGGRSRFGGPEGSAWVENPPTRYAVVGDDGEVLDVESTRDGAANRAERRAGSPDRVWLDADFPDEVLQGADFTPNPVDAELAWKRMGNLRIEQAEVDQISPEEVVRELAQFLPTERQGKPVTRYQSWDGMREALLGQNYKTEKSDPGRGLPAIDVKGLSLLPNHTWPMVLTGAKTLGAARRKLDSEDAIWEDVNTCVGASKECAQSCLVYSGRNTADVYNAVIKAGRMAALLHRPAHFGRWLFANCAAHAGLCEGGRARHRPIGGAWSDQPVPLVRLNVFSDIPWELVYPGLFEQMPGLQFYDYTKVPGRDVPENYDLTFSYSGRNLQATAQELERGTRCAVVFLTGKHKLPESWSFMGHEYPVIDGDVSDARPFDEGGVVVGLSYKFPRVGKKKAALVRKNVFVVPVHEIGGELVAPVIPRAEPGVDDDQDLISRQAAAHVSPEFRMYLNDLRRYTLPVAD